MLNKIKQYVNDYIENNKGEVLDIAQKIWENPETAFNEYFASKLYVDFLTGKGFQVETGVADLPTAFLATYGQGRPVIGLSAEYDALPGLSQKVSIHKEPVVKDGAGHGCGHNVLGAAALLGAVAIKEAIVKFGLKGTIKLFGTPAEEVCVGKVVMARKGIFDGVDLFLDWHPWTFTGSAFMTSPAYFNARYHFKGKTSHGLMPWFGRSALDAAILQGHAIEMLREHVNPGKEAIASINYTFSDTGPKSVNIVPDRATLWCVGRVSSTEDLTDLIDRVDKCAEGAATATGTTVEKQWITATHEYISNKVLAKIVYDNLMEVGDVEYTEEEKQFVADMQKEEGQKAYEPFLVKDFIEAKSGVSDAAEYGWHAPYTTFAVKLGPGPGWHNWMVAACAGATHGQKAIAKAGQLFALSATDLIMDETKVEAAQAEWRERMAGRTYECLIPEDTPIPFDVFE